MSKVILYIAMSLDGYIAGPNEDLSWLDNPDDTKGSQSGIQPNPYAYNAFIGSIGAIIMGRNTYDLEKKNGWGDMHALPKFVLTHAVQNTHNEKDIVFTDADITDVIAMAKQKTDKHIWIEGGAQIAQICIGKDVLDELIVFIAPILLGGGIRLFGDLSVYKKYTLRSVRTYMEAYAQLEYVKISKK